MEFSHNFLNGTCVIRFPLQSFIQVSWIQANPQFPVHRVSWTVRVVGINWNLLLHDHKAVDPSCHIFGLLKNSQYSKFLISSWKAPCKCIGTFLGACLVGFAFGLSWNLYGNPGNFPNSGENTRVDVKDVLLCHWTALKLAVQDRPLVGTVRQFLLRFLHFLMKK